MGSRRGRYAALAAAFVVASCTVGAPPGFSAGESWTIPLIGPLEDGLLLVPALVNGKGPYVFAIDPDAHTSIVDQQVLKETGARTGEGPHLLDENDTQQPRFFAEILEWQLGTLTVKGPKPAQLVPEHTFDAGGRRVHGVIGRDIIADSLVFGFNRDTGTAWLSTLKKYQPLPGAIALNYSTLSSRIENAQVLPISRRLVEATINGQRFTLHLDLGATPSQLRYRSWQKAKLVESDSQLALVDEVGVPREVKKQGVAGVTTVATAEVRNVAFVPYVDKRWPDQDLEGTLGLGFFKPYTVASNWDKSTFYLTPRKDAASYTKARIARWQSKTLTSCPHVGCVTATLIDPLAGKPAEEMPAQHPGLIASFVRDPITKDRDLEVLVAVTPVAGKPSLRWFVANLPAGKDRAMTHVSSDYLGATLTVLDVSMFPRTCPSDDACVDLLLPTQKIDPAAVQTLPPGTLHRRTGEDPASLITGSDDSKKILTASVKREISSMARICIEESGAIRSVTIERPSGLPQFDLKVIRTVQGTWSYEPYLVDGKATPACVLMLFTLKSGTPVTPFGP